MDDISKHLGRTSDGKLMQPYETPDRVSPELLVAVPRSGLRTENSITANFLGADVWNGYEFSCLNAEKKPVSGIIKIVYPSNSKNIVESKSLKLYLNSFNNVVFDTHNALSYAAARVKEDLSEALESEVEVRIFSTGSGLYRAPCAPPFMMQNHKIYYSDSPMGKWFGPTRSLGEYGIIFDGLRSNCRVTNQPDWGTLYIHTTSVINKKELLDYVISLRNENHFHEEICEIIYQRIWDQMNFPGADLFVACCYTRRGGIDINPIRASSTKFLLDLASPYLDTSLLSYKTDRQ